MSQTVIRPNRFVFAMTVAAISILSLAATYTGQNYSGRPLPALKDRKEIVK